MYEESSSHTIQHTSYWQNTERVIILERRRQNLSKCRMRWVGHNTNDRDRYTKMHRNTDRTRNLSVTTKDTESDRQGITHSENTSWDGQLRKTNWNIGTQRVRDRQRQAVTQKREVGRERKGWRQQMRKIIPNHSIQNQILRWVQHLWQLPHQLAAAVWTVWCSNPFALARYAMHYLHPLLQYY